MLSASNSTFDFLLGKLKQSFLSLPDKRSGKNSQYSILDGASCAFSVFFTQEGSFLAYQKRMQRKYGKSNEQTIFGVGNIPSDTQIRRLLDQVPAKRLDGVFWDCVGYLTQSNKLDSFRTSLGQKDLLIALDGTWYFSSQDIHCKNCLSKTHEQETTYYHAMINPVIAVPGKTQVIPLPPEFITNADGAEKQDCEQNGAKRWLKKHGKKIAQIDPNTGVTILGDDLYAHQPIIQTILDQGLNFIIVAKEDSHKTLYEWIKGITEEVRVEKVTGVRKVKKETWVYRFVNGVPIKDQKGKGDQVLSVNFAEVTILDEAGKRKYHNAFITNHQVSTENVEEITSCGRARWKIENENNNTLKNNGYHLEHNFGHGKKHLASVLAVLNILAFLFHTVLEITDYIYQSLRQISGRRDTLFNDIRALLKRFLFQSFSSLMEFMLGEKQIADIAHIPVPI